MNNSLKAKLRPTLCILATLFLAFLGPIQSSNAFKAGHSESGLVCRVLPQIISGYLVNHISKRSADAELEKRTVDQFIKHLDPSKIYLLEADVSEIRNTLKGVFKSLGRECGSIETAHRVFVKRLKENLSFVKETLKNDKFKFAEKTELVIDPTKRSFAENQEEAQSEMKKFIQFQISNYLASDMKLKQAKKQLIHRYELNVQRHEKLKKDELYSLFLDSVASSLDAHSNYLSKDALDDFEISMRLSLEGIGAALHWEDGYTTVESLIPGGSAEKSGLLEPKDKIIGVGQGNSGAFESVIDMPLRDVVKLIRGKKGTTVRLQILRQTKKGSTRHVIKLKRSKINLQDEAARLVYKTQKDGSNTLKIAVIDLPSFYGDMSSKTRSCYEDLKKLVKKAVKDKADGIVLDLSKNGGGLLSEAVRVAGLFIRKGNIVATQDARKTPEFLKDEDEAVDYAGPLVILTSRLSASASEIVAGALKDYKRAVIVGADHTFGKGTVQAMINLPADLGAIKVTTGMFFIPGGDSTQHRGVSADIVLPSPFSTEDIGEKALDYSLPPQSIPEFLSVEANSNSPEAHWSPVSDDLLEQLKSTSTARVEKNKEFKKILAELKETQKKKGVIKLSDSLKKQKEEKAKEEDKRTGRHKRHKRDEDYLKEPHVDEAINVVTDMIRLSSKFSAKNSKKTKAGNSHKKEVVSANGN